MTISTTGPRDAVVASAVRADTQQVTLALRTLGGDLGTAQLWFDARVLDRYRGQAEFRVIRTNSAGRVRVQGGWSVDFGIVDAAGLIHAPAGDIAQRLPPAEHRHWASHLLGLPTSRAFLSMRLAPGSCIDDGDTRDWPA